MAFSYRQVKDLYDVLADSGAVSATLPEWSDEMNRLSGTDLYSEGLHDNLIKRGSVGIDRLLEATGLPGLTEKFGRSVGETVGNPEAGAAIGKGLPRMALNFLPMLIPGVGVGATTARLGGLAALQGAEAYTSTGSPAAGVLSGSIGAALPGITGKLERAVLGRMGGRLVEGQIGTGTAAQQFSRYFPTTLTQGIGSQLAGQAGAAAVSEVGQYGQEALTGQPLHSPFSTETLLNLTLGQLPFAAIYATKGGRAALGGEASRVAAEKAQQAIDTTKLHIERQQAIEESQKKIPLENIPNFTGTADQKIVADNNQAIQNLRLRMRQLAKEPTTMNMEEWNKLSQEENSLIEQQGERPNRVAGVAVDATTPRRVVAGKEVYRNRDGTFRMIDVNDDEGNGDLRGKLIGYSTLHEPQAAPSDVPGLTNYSLPEGWFSEFSRREQSAQTPELPSQTALNQRPFDHVTALQDAESAVQAAESPVAFQDAITRLNGVRSSFDLPPLTDGQIRRRMLQTRQTDPKKAAVDLVNKTKLQINRLQEIERGEAFRAEQEAVAAQDPAVADEVAQLKELENSISIKPGKNADKLIAGGELNRLYRHWVEDGRKGKWDGFAKGVLEAARTGKGLSDVALKQPAVEVGALPKTPEAQPLKDVMTDHAVKALNEPMAKKAFDSWEGAKANPFDLEQARFALLYDELGHTLWSKPITAEDAADVNAVLWENGIEFADEKELVGFKDRPHVQVWKLATERNALEGSSHAPLAHKQPPAGGGFVWGLGQYDPTTNRLNTKHTLPKTGVIRVAQFKNMAGREGRPLPDVEIELAKVIVPEAFDEQGNVDVRKLYKGLDEKGPVLEVKTLGEYIQTEGQISRERAIHALDTEFPNWNQEDHGRTTGRLRELLDQLDEATSLHNQETSDTGRPRYSFIGPKSEQEMPGYVEGLVRLPLPGREQIRRLAGQQERIQGESLEAWQQRQQLQQDIDKIDTRKDVKYRGPHFGSEDTNVVAFFRGYEETLPGGRKAFHVIEVQSDWGQRVHDEAKGQGFGEDDIPNAPNRPDLNVPKTQSHPLLSVYETLALKAAIAHAKEVGADTLVLSDAETAMMTEGHDRAVGIGQEMTDAERAVARPPQEAGMRLHYDQTLPSSLTKLTGERGVPVELGVHKAVRPDQPIPIEGNAAIDYSQGSPVFRTPTGEPKTQITGRAYPLTRAFQNIESQDGLTMTDPSRAPGPLFVPQTPADETVVNAVGNDGRSLMTFLETSTDPFISALMKDLKGRTANIANRVRVHFLEGQEGSKANLGSFGFSNVFLGETALRLPPDLRDREFAHELLHGLTLSAIEDPVNSQQVRELDNFRRTLIEGLPERMKARFKEAESRNWMKLWQRGMAQWQDLSPNHTEAEILYGLMNNKELVSQGFSSDSMRSYMRTQKMQGGNAFKKFVNWVKTMVGFGENVKDTAFEAFLGHVDGLLDSGEYVSRLSNFAERYLVQEGLTGTLAKSQAQRAAAVVKVSSYGVTPSELFDYLSLPVAFKSVELQRAQTDLVKSYQENDANAQATGSVLKELGLPTDRNGVEDFVDSLLRGEVSSEALDVLPGTATRYIFAKLEDMRQVLDTVRAAGDQKGMINMADVEGLSSSVKTALKSVEQLLQAKTMQEHTVRAVQELSTRMAPDGFADFAMSDDSHSLRTFLGDLKEEGEKGVSWMSRFLKPPAQMARDNPETAEGISKGYELPANARKMASEGLKVFGVDADRLDGNITHDAVQRLSKALSNPRVEKAVNKWMYWNQVKGKESGVVLLPDSDPDVQKALQGLSPQEKADVTDVIVKQQISQRFMQAQIVEKMGQIAATNGATLLGRFTGMKVGQNVALADEVMKAVATDFSDPVAAQQAQATLAQVQTKMSPEAFQSILRYSQLENAKIEAWKDYFELNPAWASGQRYGKYLVRFTRGKKLFVLGADSKAEARKLAEGGVIESIESNRASEDDAPPVLGPEADKLILRLRELEENQIQMLESNGVPPDEIEAIRRTSPVAQFERETASRQSIPNVTPPPRGLTRGAEELPWLSNHFSWVQKASTYWSRQLFRAQMRAHLLEPEIAQNPELQSWMRTHFENILHQDPESVQKFKRFITTWFMGYNPANVIVNAAQPFVTHVAELTALSGKPIDSYKRVLNAMREIGGHFTGGKEWASAEHTKLMKEAVTALEVGYGKFDDEAAAQESIATNYKRILAGNKPQTVGQRLGTLAGAYSNVGMWLFQHGEQVNNRAALLASFDYYREKGLSYEDAKQKAFEFNRTVNFGGGRANRPVGAFAGRGPFPRGVAMLGTALQSYVLGTTFQLVRYLKQGLFRPTGLTPGERHAALKAGVQLLATQFAAAGLLGLPFVSGALALLDKAFPDLELNRKTRELMTGFLSSDKDNGSVLSDVAMTGVPSMLGWDLQSRLSMGNTVPGVSEVNGFQPENLLGPGASLVSNFVNGTRKLAQRDSSGALNFVPLAVRKLAELVKEDGQIQDYRGRPLFDPTPGEKIGIALGFNPKRLNDFNAAQRVVEQNRAVETRRNSQWVQSLAEDAVQGNFGTVRAALLAKSQSDKTFDPIEAVRAVARASEELTFPRDLRREGTQSTSSSRNRLLASFRLNPSQPTEVARLQFRQQIENRLGLVGTPSRELVIAQLIDQGRVQNPNATRTELRRQAELALRRAPVQALASPLEGQ